MWNDVFAIETLALELTYPVSVDISMNVYNKRDNKWMGRFKNRSDTFAYFSDTALE